MFSPLLEKRKVSKRSQQKDLIEYYYEDVNHLATFVSMLVIAISLLRIDADVIPCEDSYTGLVWTVLIFFQIPILIPYI